MYPTPFPSHCNRLIRLVARVVLWLRLRRRAALSLLDYERGLRAINWLVDRAHCDCAQEVRDKRAREATDAYRRRAIAAAMRGGGSDE